MPFYRKFIRPNRSLTDFFGKLSFDRIWFRQKLSFDRKKMRTRSFDRKFIWTKVIWPKAFFWKWSFDQKVNWPNVFFFWNEKRFTDSNDESRLFYLLSKTFSVKWPFSKKKTFGQMTIFQKKSIRSNVLSIKWQFFGKIFWSNDHFSKKAFGQKWTFGHVSFRSFD
jgi:hypothetical protein